VKPIRTLPAADGDVLEAAAHYDLESAGLGDEFVEEVRLGMERIAELPDAWPPFSGGMRRLLIKRFPYGILYRNLRDLILIFAVQHTKRRPNTWRSRWEDSL
jgi:plasmid stabilization system protein ParE